jgi:hypothetical protein
MNKAGHSPRSAITSVGTLAASTLRSREKAFRDEMSTADPVSDLPLTQLLAISGLGRQTERDDEAALFGDPTVVCPGTPDDVVAWPRQHMIGVAQLKSKSSPNQDDDSGAAVVDDPTSALVPSLVSVPLDLER